MGNRQRTKDKRQKIKDKTEKKIHLKKKNIIQKILDLSGLHRDNPLNISCYFKGIQWMSSRHGNMGEFILGKLKNIKDLY